MRVPGHCLWEKTSNGCKNDGDTFKHNAYDFYALCRGGGDIKHAEFQCKEEPAKLNAGRCADRKDGVTKKGHEKKESSSGKSDEEDSSYYYVKSTTRKKYCYDCQLSKCMHHALACSWSARSG